MKIRHFISIQSKQKKPSIWAEFELLLKLWSTNRVLWHYNLVFMWLWMTPLMLFHKLRKIMHCMCILWGYFEIIRSKKETVSPALQTLFFLYPSGIIHLYRNAGELTCIINSFTNSSRAVEGLEWVKGKWESSYLLLYDCCLGCRDTKLNMLSGILYTFWTGTMFSSSICPENESFSSVTERTAKKREKTCYYCNNQKDFYFGFMFH